VLLLRLHGLGLLVKISGVLLVSSFVLVLALVLESGRAECWVMECWSNAFCREFTPQTLGWRYLLNFFACPCLRFSWA
jgi:hypothetical protein